MLVGRNPLMRELRERIDRIAQTDFTVLIEGESGAGKELVAREIHEASTRCAGPFVAVNCAALVETLIEAELFGIEERTATGVRGRRGKFEMADQGTLFLDEVGDMSPTAQAKLLRVLQDMCIERVGGDAVRRVDTRVVAATNRTLTSMVEAGRFRPDLYYRLSGVELVVPPLRARADDIPLLVDYFLDRFRRTRDIGISAEALEVLLVHDWPGNVRQLVRVLERAVALAPSDRITTADLPASVLRDHRQMIRPSARHDDTLRGWSSRYVRAVLERCGGNKRRACALLDISYHTLQSHLTYDPARRRRRAGTSASAPRMVGSWLDAAG
jgi:transcriptional regulator with PAS, ATPase and Fis domain